MENGTDEIVGMTYKKNKDNILKTEHKKASNVSMPDDQDTTTVNMSIQVKENTDERSGRCSGMASFCDDLSEIARDADCKGSIQRCCTLENLRSKFPITYWLPKYRCPEFQGDLIAGLTVGLTVIPQGLAYASVAELPPQYGLYSAFMGCFVYAFFGTSKDVTLGPTAIMSLMTAAFGALPDGNDASLAIFLTFVSGIVQLLMGIFSLGFLVDYIPYPVINSFTTSAAITIAFGQVQKWLGLKKGPREFLPQVIWTFENIAETRLYDCILGLVCMIILYAMKRLKAVKWNEENISAGKAIFIKVIWVVCTARNALVVIAASGLSAGLISINSNNSDIFTLTDNIPGGIPPFELPPFSIPASNMTTMDMFSKVGAGLIIVPLMGVVESIAIGNAFARVNNYKIDANQEFIAIGASNIMGSFVSSYPVTGSFSRTAVNSQSGVRTPAGGIWTGLLVLLALGLLTPLFHYIPTAALAGVIIMAVVDMVSFALLPKLWKIKRVDIIPWVVTFVGSLFLGIEYGIIIGIAVAMLLLLYPWARPGLKIVNREVVVVQMKSGLLFPATEYVKDKILEQATSADSVRSVVLDCTHLTHIDYTVVMGFKQLLVDFSRNNIFLVFACLQDEILEILLKSDMAHFRYTSTVDEGCQLVLDEVDPEEDPRQSLLKKPDSTSSIPKANRSNSKSSNPSASHDVDSDGDDAPDVQIKL